MTSFLKARTLSFERALATFRAYRFWACLSIWDTQRRSISSVSRREVHTSIVRIPAKSAMDRRYARATARLTDSRSSASNPRSRPATAKLVTSRLTSHSNGPGSVSSKSLMLKTSRRSGAAKTPKFDRCASPHSCTDMLVRGVPARSDAIR